MAISVHIQSNVRNGVASQHRSAISYGSAILAAIAVSFLSLTVALPVHAQNVTTQHYDNTRSGSYTFETQLSPSTVSPSTFSRLFSDEGYLQSFETTAVFSALVVLAARMGWVAGRFWAILPAAGLGAILFIAFKLG